jgi:hypothetical protein
VSGYEGDKNVCQQVKDDTADDEWCLSVPIVGMLMVFYLLQMSTFLTAEFIEL